MMAEAADTGLYSTIMPDYASMQDSIEMRRALANALMQKAMNPDQGQMISGHYVSPGLSGIAPILQGLESGMMRNSANKSSLNMNTKLVSAMKSAYPDLFGSQQQPMNPVSTDSGMTGAAIQNGTNSAAGMPANVPSSLPVQTMPVQSAQVKPDYMKARMLGNMFGTEAQKTYLSQFAPTDLQKTDTYLGINPQQSRDAEIAKRRIAGTQTFQPNQMSILPTGQTVIAPDFGKGTYGGFDANGQPQMGVIPGATGAIGATTGASSMATEGVKDQFASPSKVTTPYGEFNWTPMQQRAYSQFGIKGVYPNYGGGTQPVSQGSGGMPGALLSPAQAEIEKAKGTAAVNAANTNAQVAPLLQVIQQARTLAPNVPQGLTGEARVKWEEAFPNKTGANPSIDASNKWTQMMGQSILSTIKNLQSSGSMRMDIPIVREIEKAGGIPAYLPLSTKLQMLDQLESEVKNASSSANNIIPQLNSANVGNNIPAQMINPPPQSAVPQNAIQAEIARRRALAGNPNG